MSTYIHLSEAVHTSILKWMDYIAKEATHIHVCCSRSLNYRGVLLTSLGKAKVSPKFVTFDDGMYQIQIPTACDFSGKIPDYLPTKTSHDLYWALVSEKNKELFLFGELRNAPSIKLMEDLEFTLDKFIALELDVSLYVGRS